MIGVVLFWGGKRRRFLLTTLGKHALEEAFGQGIGQIINDVVRGNYHDNLLRQALFWGLVGGGEAKSEADRLVNSFFDLEGLESAYAVTVAMFSEALNGIIRRGDTGEKPKELERIEQVYALCTVFNMSPADVDAMPYARLVNMIGFYNELTDNNLAPPSEEEMLEIVAKYEGK